MQAAIIALLLCDYSFCVRTDRQALKKMYWTVILSYRFDMELDRTGWTKILFLDRLHELGFGLSKYEEQQKQKIFLFLTHNQSINHMQNCFFWNLNRIFRN